MPDDPTYRAPPRNIEAEQALLGAILINNDAYHRVVDILQVSHFSDDLHRAIYETASKLISAGKCADPITLKPFFANLEPIDPATTIPQYLGRLAANAATIVSAKDYARTIRDLATRRSLIVIGEDITNAAYDSPVDFPSGEQIEEAETRLYALAEQGVYGSGELNAIQLHAAGIEAIEKAYRHKGEIGLSTGLKDLDAKMGRLQTSDLVIYAGRPAMGKTALATKIIRSHSDVPVHFFSLEMSAEQISHRLISDATGIPTEKMRKGDLEEEDWRKVIAAHAELKKQPLHVDDTGGLSVAQVTARARRLKRQHGTQLIIVDYLQLMRGTARRGDNRVQEITEITNGLKALAKELKVPVVALSQINRAVESRTDKRPQLADLRDSGSIEQDADIVLFVYREEYYLERARPEEGSVGFQDWMAKMDAASGKAELIIAKNRHGPIGLVPVHFDSRITRFSDLARSAQMFPAGHVDGGPRYSAYSATANGRQP